MKPAAVVLLLATALASPAPAASDGGPQTMHGRVILPSGPFANCLFLEALVDTALNVEGAFGYLFDVDPRTYGDPFVLTPDAPADLDIVFLGTQSINYDVTDRGFEKRGIVPQGADRAMVCLAAGGPTDFTYAAG